MPSLRRILPLIVALLALAAPASAPADTADQILRDCNDDGVLSRDYSDRDLQRALDALPADQAEYSYCVEVINAAFGSNPKSGGGAAGAGGGGSGSGGSGGVASPGSAALPNVVPQPTAEDLTALAQSRALGQRGDAPAVSVGGRDVTPGAGGVTRTAAAANALPLPLLLLLIAVALIVLAGTLPAARRPLADASRVARRIVRR